MQALKTEKRVDFRGSAGFTVIELMVTVGIIGILTAIAFPNFGSVRGQMRASEDARSLAYHLGELRAEAIRQKTSVRISFSDSGYSWDIGDDSTNEGSIALNQNSEWSSNTPSDIVFNGLGLLRGIGNSSVDITVGNLEQKITLTINGNGYLEI